jgi:eukaryotic-like serine/threonine-protein kinase
MIEALEQRYEVLAELGEGGFGRVFAVRDRDSGARLAVKTISRPDPLRLSLLKREARLVGGIVHPNLLTLHGLEQAGDQIILTMELVDGVRLDSWVTYGSRLFTKTQDAEADTAELPQHLISLSLAPVAFESIRVEASAIAAEPASSSVLRSPWNFSTLAVDLDGEDDLFSAPPTAVRTGPPPELDRLREAMGQVATALAALHSIGRVHRDLKPDNVLVERDGRVVLLDFGLAFVVGEEGEEGKAIGTPGFMAPEQIRGERCTPAVDWYAFGAVLYLLLYGSPPYSGDVASLARIARGGEPDPHPMPEPGLEMLADLAARLLHPEPEHRPGADEVLAVLEVIDGDACGGLATTQRVAVLREWASQTGPVVIGREAELSVLSEAWDRVLEGSPAIVAFHGPSGTGRSTLVEAFCAGLGDVPILRGRCFEHESVPFAGWDALVDQLADLLVEQPPWMLDKLLAPDAVSLLRLFPMLAKVDALTALKARHEPPADPAELRDAAFDALFAILAGLAAQRPLVVRLDDLHWADRGSAAVALRLFETLPPRPLLVLLSWRDDEEVPAELRRLAETERCVEVVVGPLSQEHSRQVAERLLPARFPDREAMAERIARQSGGLPLFITELAMAAAQDLDADGDLEALIRRRVEALPDEARRLLRVVAMAGRPVSLRAAGEVADCGSPELAARVLAAEALVRSSGRKGRTALECINGEVVEALRADLGVAETREVLLGLAERTPAEKDPEAKGRHLLAAGEERQAAPLLLEAATRALDALAFERAEELLALAEPGLPDRGARRRCAMARAEALTALGRGPAAAEQYLAAADAGDLEQLQRCQRLATEQLVRAGDFLGARSLLSQVLGRAGMRMPGGSITTVLGLLVRRLLIRLRGLRYRRRAEAEVPPALLERLDTAAFVSQSMSLFAPVPAAFLQVRALQMALRAGEPRRVAQALAVEAGLTAAMGGRSLLRAEELLAASNAASQDLTAPRLRTLQLLARSILAFQHGHWQASQEHAEQAADLARTRCRGAAWELGTGQIYQLVSLASRGEFTRLARLLPRAIRRAEDRGDAFTELHLRLSIPCPIACVRDRPAEGREEVLEAWSRWGGLEWGLLELYALRQLIELALYERDHDEAKRRSDELWKALSGSPTKYVRITTLFAHASRLRVALLGAARGLAPPSTLKKDLSALSKADMAWAQAEAAAARAQLALLAGADVAHLLGDAAVLYAQAGQRAHAEAARLASTGKPLEEADDLPVDWLKGQGVVNPARFVRMLLPGLK